MTDKERKPIAFITGAGGGLGAAFARQFAGKGYDLILTDYRREPLDETAASLRERFDAGVEILVADLRSQEDLIRLCEVVRGCDRLEVLVNNAGLGGDEPRLEDNDVHYLMDMLDVNAKACLCLCWAALPGMVERGKGNILNVSALAGLEVARYASPNYGATKAYIVHLSVAIQLQLDLQVKNPNIRVQAICPGPIDTEMGTETRSTLPRAVWMKADRVAELSYRALKRRSSVFLPGLSPWLTALFGVIGMVKYYYKFLRLCERIGVKLGLLKRLDA